MSDAAPSYVPDPDRYDGRMPYRKCGRWGLKLLAITLGCWHNFGGSAPTENMRKMANEVMKMIKSGDVKI